MNKTLLALITAALAFACAEPGVDAPANDVFDDLVGGQSKADMVKNAHIIDDIDLDSTINARFRPRVRVHGFTFEAKAGADIRIELATHAGKDSADARTGEALDTVAAVYGPVRGDDKGRRLAYNDDNDAGLEAQLPEIEINEDGRYLVVFSSWNDPGAEGTYDISVACDGTNYQCRRPQVDRPCLPGTRYIQGQTIVGTETWSRCNVVLLESTIVEEGAVLTIEPGVNVQGNFLGAAPHGDVTLQVDGSIQAVGNDAHPVVFTALRDGWKGVVLNGDSNTLRHVYVEKAAEGVRLAGSANTLEDVVVDHSLTALHFAADSLDNTVRRARIDSVTHGLILDAGAAVRLTDSAVIGTGAAGVGLRAREAAATHVERSVVTGFLTGLELTNSEVYVTDTTIAKNSTGVVVTGPDAGVHPPFTCPDLTVATPPSRPRPTPPRTWPRDPVFTRVDLRDNADHGLRILAPQLVVVDGSNIRGNGHGVSIEADSLHTESRITGSNVLENGGDGVQVDSWHINGVLDVSGNYWKHISDPELSASWLVNHQMTHACTVTSSGVGGCRRVNSRRYTCGAYTCNYTGSRWSCATSVRSDWTGEVKFTGFSPEVLEAGPTLVDLPELVSAVRRDLGYDAAEAPVEEPGKAGRIVINEIDYDQPGRDDAEFVELYNPGDEPVSLAGVQLELVNGATGRTYATFDLTAAGSTLAPGAYLLVADAKVLDAMPDDCAGIPLTRSLQNGSPDGVRLVTSGGDFVDGLAYEGWMPYVGEGDSPLARESNSGLNESLSRCGNGVDTDDNAGDFKATEPSPGLSNLCD